MSYTEGDTYKSRQEVANRIHARRESLGLPSLLHLQKYDSFMEPDANLPDDLNSQLEGVSGDEKSQVVLDWLKAKRDVELFGI